MQNQVFSEKEQITDLLSAEKFLAGNYNTFLAECATPEMVRCLSALLNDTNAMQQTVFHEMAAKGWYPVTKAEDAKVNATKAKFEQSVSR